MRQHAEGTPAKAAAAAVAAHELKWCALSTTADGLSTRSSISHESPAFVAVARRDPALKHPVGQAASPGSTSSMYMVCTAAASVGSSAPSLSSDDPQITGSFINPVTYQTRLD